MKSWIIKNLKSIIVTAFVIPILLVAFVSISHVTSFYGISNPMTWAMYLSVAVEIAAISALAGVSVKLGRFIYFPFILVTFIQFVGNLFFSFSYINETSELFKTWMEMASPIFEPMGIESSDISKHKLILAFFSGGLLPLISLTFAHMLVVYSNKQESVHITPVINIDEISKKAGLIEKENLKNEEVNISQENLNKLEEYLKKIQSEKFPENQVQPEIPEKKVEETFISENEIQNEPKIEIEEIDQEQIVVENQTVEELKDKLAENSGIKRLTYTKNNA